MNSEKESRKAIINEDIKSVKDTITGNMKQREKEFFDVMEKSVTADADMTKVFTKKSVALNRSCDEAKKEIEVLDNITRTRSKESQTVYRCTI